MARRYLGFLFAGKMVVFAISGFALAFRNSHY